MTKPQSRFATNHPQMETNLANLAQAEMEKEGENLSFKNFLRTQDGRSVDALVQALNAEITPKIDCTRCGNCCKSLMINVTEPEAENLSVHLQMDIASLKQKYIETSQQGNMVINTIPCHFLSGTKCGIYAHRFAECREFPGLHRPNFTERLFATFMHYGRCPIVYNVIERLKEETGFTIDQTT
jgi:Fe-S-cluster containining protein